MRNRNSSSCWYSDLDSSPVGPRMYLYRNTIYIGRVKYPAAALARSEPPSPPRSDAGRDVPHSARTNVARRGRTRRERLHRRFRLPVPVPGTPKARSPACAVARAAARLERIRARCARPREPRYRVPHRARLGSIDRTALAPSSGPTSATPAMSSRGRSSIKLAASRSSSSGVSVGGTSMRNSIWIRPCSSSTERSRQRSYAAISPSVSAGNKHRRHDLRRGGVYGLSTST